MTYFLGRDVQVWILAEGQYTVEEELIAQEVLDAGWARSGQIAEGPQCLLDHF